MSATRLYKILYVLVHVLYTIYEKSSGIIREAALGFVDFCHEFGGARRIRWLKQQIDSGNKVPKHLTVLLGQEEPSYYDLANIVQWCLLNRILFLSFYDYKGTLEKHRDKLEKMINKRISPMDHVFWHNNPGSTFKNGFIGRKIHLKLLSRENGKENIVKATREFCKGVTIKCDGIESVNSVLRKEFEFSDPDMAIHCGKNLCLHDYPPWQIRVTEFLSVKSHHRISYRTFLEQLYVYGKCEQRLGK